MMHMHQSGLSCEGNASQGNAPVGARLNGTALPSVSLNRPARSLPSQRSQPVTKVIDVRRVGQPRTPSDAYGRAVRGKGLPSDDTLAYVDLNRRASIERQAPSATLGTYCNLAEQHPPARRRARFFSIRLGHRGLSGRGVECKHYLSPFLWECFIPTLAMRVDQG